MVDETARMRRLHPSAADGLLAVTVVTWAAAFPAITIGLTGYPPMALGLLRLLAASLTLAVAAAFTRLRRPPRRMWPRVVLAGLLGQTLYQGLLMVGELRVPAGTASILIATAPAFSVVAAALLLKESARGRWLGMLIAFGGAAMVGATLGLGGGLFAIAVLVAAACQGIYHVIVKPLSEQIGAFAATTWSVWAGTVMMLPALPSALRVIPTASTSATEAAIFLGVIPSALGYLTWSAAVARTPIAHSTASLYLVPVVALALALALLGEQPQPLALVGGALAIAGVTLIRHPRHDRRVERDVDPTEYLEHGPSIRH